MSSAEPGRIDVRVREWSQIFNSFDPSPFHEQDLAREAEDYIVDSLKELPVKRASEIRVHVELPPGSEGERSLESAIHTYFARRALHVRRTLRDLIRDGMISLFIGLTVLVVFFVLGEIVESRWGERRWGPLARESLLIGGWVAMWRPLEIFLYKWWPMVGRRRMYEHLSRVPVRLVTRGIP